MQNESIKPVGKVNILIEYSDGHKEHRLIKNAVLSTGRAALASCLLNDISNPFDFYISSMTFGSGGADVGGPKYIESNRTGLFGPQVASKPVSGTLDPAIDSQINFLAVLTFNELDGTSINELGLQMASGDLYSMTTFDTLVKTSAMQITFSWSISFV